MANRDTIKVIRGSYEVELSLPGYKPLSKKVEVQIGQPYSFYFQLTKQKGKLQVVTDASNARIFLDNRLVGEGGIDDSVTVGVHHIRAESPTKFSLKNALNKL